MLFTTICQLELVVLLCNTLLLGAEIAIGEDINHNGYFEMPGYSYNEYKENCVITTSFINKNFPLIRYQVNDKIALKKDYTKAKAIEVNPKS